MATPMRAIPAGSRLASENRFFVGMALAILVVVFVGFARSFFLQPLFPEWHRPSETIFYVHGAAFTAWIVLLIAQVSLVAGGRKDVHRRIGPYGAGLAAPNGRPGHARGVDCRAASDRIHRRPGSTACSSSRSRCSASRSSRSFVGMAIAKRRDPQTHKRCMLLGTIVILGAAFARFPVVGDYGPPAIFALVDLLMVPLIIWDFRTRGRLHPVTLWGGAADHRTRTDSAHDLGHRGMACVRAVGDGAARIVRRDGLASF